MADISPTAQQEPITSTKLLVTQTRSTIGCKQNQRATLLSLGLRKIRQTVERPDTAQIRGMIHTVRHLVTVEEVHSK
ncbi:50S ribosomal protein L30 [Pseudonocardia sp. GCM10023141]|uniref:50S ribosomal protein L30 n=1 Tax=Pseudonocardia sp. GCM10023141 TaxID=3252653 RepID=UPI003605D904